MTCPFQDAICNSVQWVETWHTHWHDGRPSEYKFSSNLSKGALVYCTLQLKESIAAERMYCGRKKALRPKYRRAEVVAAATERVLRPQDAAAIVTAWLTLVH